MKQCDNYLPIIGLEVHVELKTKSKMFCGCSAQHFLVKPNTHTCPVCLGLPGALPVPNKKAIEWCLMLGLALDCKINEESKFDRKNYFYPDLPKGYQISQYDQSFAENGSLKIKDQRSKIKIIKINRVHMEEDTAKLIHQFGTQNSKLKTQKDEYTLIDFNRSGVPLVEVVSEPDINSSEEAVLYLKKLQQIIRYLDISDADMEKGSMRCEVNISLKRKAKSEKRKLPNYKVEVKNINSFRFVKKAIDYEIERQKKILESGKIPIQETRGFDEKKGKTFTQRTKEEAHDYRYFPEPDIPPFVKLKSASRRIKAELPELPDTKIERFMEEYGLSEYNATILAQTIKKADYFEEAVKIAKKINKTDMWPSVDYVKFVHKIANVIINKRIDIKKYLPAQLIKMLIRKTQGQITDEKEVEKVVRQVLKENSKAVADYKKGKTQVIGFLIGQVMRGTKGKANPAVIQEKIKLLITNY